MIRTGIAGIICLALFIAAVIIIRKESKRKAETRMGRILGLFAVIAVSYIGSFYFLFIFFISLM